MVKQLLPLTHHEMLEQMTAPTLKTLAIKLAAIFPADIDTRALPTRKDDVLQLIYFTLLPDDNLAKAVAALSTSERQTISMIVYDPSRCLDHGRYQALYRSSPTLPDYANVRLLNAFISLQGTITADLATRLRPLVPAPKSPEAVYLDAEPPVDDEQWIHTTEQAACHDVMAILNLIEQKAVKVSSTTGQVTESGADILRGVLLAGDYYTPEQDRSDNYDVQMGPRGIKPFAWVLLVQAAGLAVVSGGKLTLTAAGNKARTQPPHEVLRTIWQRWLKYTDFHEFSRLEEIKGQKSAKKPLTKPNLARKAIANALAQLAVNRWMDVDEFFAFLFAIGERYTVVNNAWALYHADANYGAFGYSGTDWAHLDGRFGMAFLLEYAATLGIIDVGITLPWGARDDFRDLWGWDENSCMSRYDGLYDIRLTPLGAWILGAATTYEPQRADGPSCTVLPNLEIVLLRPVDPAVRLQLERVADPIDANVYQLSKARILDACDTGIALPELQAVLAAQVDQELPDTVQALFREIEANLGKFTLDSAGYLIRCTDSWLITMICNDPAVKKSCLPVGEHAFFLRKGAVKALRLVLKKLGCVMPGLPAAEE